MQDQHFMQSWAEGHQRFSADLDRRLHRLLARAARRPARHRDIGAPYESEAEARAPLVEGARASLRGLAASVLTATLWIVVISLATPAPGPAAPVFAHPEACDCAQPALA